MVGWMGFSRLIVNLSCSTNNTASSLLANFMEAVGRHGWPSRVRADMGGENVDVADAKIPGSVSMVFSAFKN